MGFSRTHQLLGLIGATALLGSLVGCGGHADDSATSTVTSGAVTPDQAREIAKRAYIYGFPMVDNYRVQHSYFVDKQSPQYAGPWNELHSTARVYTPADTTVQTPNSDTPYSFLGADLRTEPLVLTVPPIDPNRYYSVQFVDAYTYNFDYVGSRTSGNGGGTFLLAGPGWKGDKPAGIDRVLTSETDFVLVIYRTQLFELDDLDNVKKIQAGYGVEPLSAFLKQSAPPAAPVIDFPKPLTAEQQKTSPEFFNIMNFTLRYAPVLPSEKALRDQFASIGIGPDGDFNAATLRPEMRTAIESGMADACNEFNTLQKDKIDTGQLNSGDFFGTREALGDNYLYRMAGAVIGIYGNTKQEALYPIFSNDAAGAPLDGANNYTFRFPPGQLPPVNAFWSLTMYTLPSSLLVENPINRYLINSPMLPNLIKDADGGYTLYIQNQSPGPDKEANWLPAPEGTFRLVERLYWPKEQALNGQWQPATPQKA